jgi:AraC-like DNA-binding protein
MDFKNIISENKLETYVNDILVLENKDETKKSVLPFFADGYPGVMFLHATNDVFITPQNKKLCDLFLYGQTIEPIEIFTDGAYRMIVFQLYPSAMKILFDIKPKELNDDCYDLNLINNKDIKQKIKKLFATNELIKQVEIIAAMLAKLAEQNIYYQAQQVQQAVNLILESKGKITVKDLTEYLHLTERTLQRLFVDYVGISPKQFAKIIQFQTSFTHISNETFSKLTEIAYENGYADQTHYIRNFKRFTRKKPSQFKSSKN